MPERLRGMRNELILGLVILLLAASAITWTGSILLTRKAFDHMVEQNDLEAARKAAAILGTWYQTTGSWSGVEAEIRELGKSGILATQDEGDPRDSRGLESRVDTDGDGEHGQDFQETKTKAGENQMDRHHGKKGPESGDLPMVLADRDGTMIYDGFVPVDGSGGENLPSRFQTSLGEKVLAHDQVVGYVFFRSMVISIYNPREAAFIRSVSLALGLSVLVGLIFSVVLGIVLAGRFVRPLVHLEEGVKAITAGNLESRVQARGSKEVVSLSESFNAMADRLKATETARQNLIADLAHELRTPVSILQANLEMMMEGVYQPDAARLSSMYEETRLLSRLIGDLRTISDMELGMADSPIEPVNLDQLLEESVRSCQSLFAEKQMSLDLEFEVRHSIVQGDSYRLMQVIRNILDNALKYAGSGTSVRVKVREVNIGGTGSSDSSWIRVSVIDQGPGVPESDLARIFERFYRVDRSRNRETGGRGLGLALSNQFIQACGGSMGAETGEGLEIWFQLPRAPGRSWGFSL